MRTAVLLLFLTACGGSPFTAGVTGDDSGESPETSVPDGGSHDSGGAESDGAVGDVVNDTNPIDARSETDAPSEAPAYDAPPESACVVGQPFACNGNGASDEHTTPPDQYCWCSNGTCGGGNPYGPGMTPSQCRTCETYTCACIQQWGNLNFKSCSETNGQITVILN